MQDRWSHVIELGGTVVLTIVLFGCGSEQSPRGGSEMARDDASAHFHLVAVGEHPPEWYFDTGTDCLVPSVARYTIGAGRWKEERRHPMPHAGCGMSVDSSSWEESSTSSGSYRLQGDTIQFYVDDTRIGVDGWVNYALMQGDTLRFLAGEFDPGDFVYVKAD